MQRFYGKRRDFQAAFAQRYTYAALGRTKEKSGVVQVKRPGLLRWEYAAPDKRLLVLDGKAFWQWSPDDNQVSVKRDVRGEQLSSAFTFLWGKGDLLKDFVPRALALPEGLPAGDAVLLVPKESGGSVQQIIFSVDKQGRVLASVVTDAQGNENRLIFSNAKIDQKLPTQTSNSRRPRGPTSRSFHEGAHRRAVAGAGAGLAPGAPGAGSCAGRMVTVDGREVPYAQAASDAFEQARQTLAAGRFDEAATQYGQFLIDYPDSEQCDEARLRRGQSLERAGKLADAQTVLRRCSRTIPTHASRTRRRWSWRWCSGGCSRRRARRRSQPARRR